MTCIFRVLERLAKCFYEAVRVIMNWILREVGGGINKCVDEGQCWYELYVFLERLEEE